MSPHCRTVTLHLVLSSFFTTSTMDPFTSCVAALTAQLAIAGGKKVIEKTFIDEVPPHLRKIFAEVLSIFAELVVWCA